LLFARQGLSNYELKASFTYVVQVLEHSEIPYMVVGGFAAIFYGEPRLTLDVDIVVDMRTEHIKISDFLTQVLKASLQPDKLPA